MKWQLGWPHRRVTKRLGISIGAMSATVRRAKDAGMTWSDVEGLTDDVLEERLYGVTLALLHEEYLWSVRPAVNA